MRLWPIRNNKRKTESTCFNLNLFFFLFFALSYSTRLDEIDQKVKRGNFLKVFFLTLQLKSHFVFFFLPVCALLLIKRPFVVAFQFSISSPRKLKKIVFLCSAMCFDMKKAPQTKACAPQCSSAVNLSFAARHYANSSSTYASAIPQKITRPNATMCASVLRIHCSNYQRLSKGKKSLQFSNLFNGN